MVFQCNAMCLLDYEFHVLDNAFLVHRPGIKKSHKNPKRDKLSKESSKLMRKTIEPELEALYGRRSGC